MIAVAPSGPALESMETAIDGLAARGARVIVIADRDDVLARGVAPLRLVPGVPEWLSPLITVDPGPARGVPARAARRRSTSTARTGSRRSR